MSVASRVAARLRINRRVTVAFIAQAPVEIALIPVVRTETLAGGWIETDQPARDSQTFTIVRNNTQFRSEVQRTEVGEARISEYMLLGEWDADMAVGDHWTAADGREWTIVDMMFDNGYERRGIVNERGR